MVVLNILDRLARREPGFVHRHRHRHRHPRRRRRRRGRRTPAPSGVRPLVVLIRSQLRLAAQPSRVEQRARHHLVARRRSSSTMVLVGALGVALQHGARAGTVDHGRDATLCVQAHVGIERRARGQESSRRIPPRRACTAPPPAARCRAAALSAAPAAGASRRPWMPGTAWPPPR